MLFVWLCRACSSMCHAFRSYCLGQARHVWDAPCFGSLTARCHACICSICWGWGELTCWAKPQPHACSPVS